VRPPELAELTYFDLGEQSSKKPDHPTDHTILKKLGGPRPIPPPEDPAVSMARLLADHRADTEETATCLRYVLATTHF
jgi:hypothetical protein